MNNEVRESVRTSEFGCAGSHPREQVMGELLGVHTRPGQSERKQRISVRLDESLAELLAETSRKTGQKPSRVVRALLRFGLLPGASEREESGSFEIAPEGAQTYVFPPELGDLLPRYRSFGMETWP